MSDRDDIDVIDNADKKADNISESEERQENNNTNNKFNHAIRQNPLTHSDERSSNEKTTKTGFFQRLKRAFSTEDAADELSVNEESDDDGLIENTDIISGFFGKFKKDKNVRSDSELEVEENTESEEPNITNNTENKTADNTDVEQSPSTNEESVTENEETPAEFDPEEEEEFRMISAFLEGEEYQKPPVENTEQLDTESDTKEEKTDEEVSNAEESAPGEEKVGSSEETNVNIASETESNNEPDVITEYDKADAFESEEAVFDVADAFENEEADFIMLDIDDEDFTDELDESDEQPKESDSDTSENPIEKTEKSEETQTAEKIEEEAAETQTAEKTNNETTETEVTETTAEETTETEVTETTAEETAETEVTETTEEKTAETEITETTEEKTAETEVTETTAEKTAETEITETTAEKTVETEVTETTEETTETEVTETTAEKTAETEVTETTAEKTAETESSDEFEDDDEEFRFEEEFVFDETDDEEFEELQKTADSNDYTELEGIFNTTQLTSGETLSDTNNSESENDSPKQEADPAGSPEKDEASENDPDEKSPDLPEEKTDSEKTESESSEKESQTLVEPEALPTLEIKFSEESPKTEQDKNDEVQKAEVQNYEPVDLNSDKNDDSSKLGKLKRVFAKTKVKLVEMWNAKEEEPRSSAEDKANSVGGAAPVNELKSRAAANETASSFGEKTDAADLSGEKSSYNDTDKSDADESRRELLAESTEYGTVFESDPEETEQIGSKEDSSDKTELVDISQSQGEESSDVVFKPRLAPMNIIKNETPVVHEVDKDKLRESFNVIEGDKISDKPDVLNDEQKRQLEMNRKVLEKVKQYEEETAEKREELRKARAENSAKAYEKAFGTVDPISELDVDNYLRPEPVEIIKVKSGKFSETVKSEYEFYVGYSRLQNVAKKQTKYVSPTSSQSSEQAAGSLDAETKPVDEKRFSEFSDDAFAKSRDKLESISKRFDYRDSKHPEEFEYRSEEDASKVRSVLHGDLKHKKMQFMVSFGLAAVVFILSCLSGVFGVGVESDKDNSERIFAFINLLLYGAMLYNCKDIILRGLQPLKKIKSNSDTSIAAAAVVTALQSVLAIIVPTAFLMQGLNLYTLVVMLALTLTTYGNYKNAQRVAANFRFVSDSSQKYTGKFFHDQRMVATLLSGTKNEKSELVFQKKTAFLKHFIRLSCSPDPGEELAEKFAVPTLVFSLFISIIYIFLSKSFFDAISLLSIMLCVSVPMCSKALGAVPLYKLAKQSLANKSMVVGYQAVENFSESAAVMIDAKELYPEGSVHLNGIKTFDSRRVNDAMLAAASVIITAGGAMSGMFDGIIQGDKQENLPVAENVMYEDGKGLIGWVNNERIFIGNRQLLRSHGISPMPVDYEEKYKRNGNEILYLACSGTLVAMFIVGYSANRRVADALSRMEANGMSLLIRTTDVNITAERIAKDFGIAHRNIKILEQKNSNVIRDEMIGKEKSSPAFIATKGGVTSFGRAVSGCIRTKRNISLSLAVQVVGVLLGLLIVTVIALFSGVQHVGAIQMFMCYLLWTVGIFAAPMIVQRIQKY